MARAPRPPAPEYSSLIASAVRLPTVKRDTATTKTQSWQDEAARLYDVLGELRFTANWVGQIMSRATLTCARGTTTLTEVKSGPARDALDAYFDGWQGQAEMQRLSGIHLTVTGECYHVYISNQEKWYVVAYNKARQQVDLDDGEGWRVITKGSDIVIRVWNPHPMQADQADSPVRSNLSALQEIERCNLHIQATLTSRLAGAGVMFVPDEVTFPKPEDADPNDTAADIFMRVLGEAMTTPIQQPGHPAAVVPLVVMAPGEYLSSVRHLTFWSELSDSIITTRDAAIKRFALGMDVPAEVLTGMADSNHWNAWLIDEASVKAHTEPRLAVLANAITTAYLWPAIEGEVPDPKKYGIVADTAQIRLRPNRSSEAIELFDRDELSGTALRRETGFDETDAPTEDERKAAVLRRIAQAASSPEQAAEAIRLLTGVELTPEGIRQEQPDNLGTPDRRDNPQGDRSMPNEPTTAAVVAACDALVFRALERAGNRLKSAHRYTGKAPAYEVYLNVEANPKTLDVLFTDCWGPVPKILGNLTPDTERVTLALDSYCKFLVREQLPHTTDALREALALARL
jgi:hypothetical protein